VYAQGIDLKNPAIASPIGMGCKVCERRGCPQRAFPPLAHKLSVSENESAFEPSPFRDR
jgi:predicted transcriptional regulator